MQTWLALPEQLEEINPEFFHTNAPDLPLMEDREFKGRLIIGSMHGVNSPVIQHAETLYADIEVLPGGRFHIPPTTEERAIYTLRGVLVLLATCFRPIGFWLSALATILWLKPDRKARILCFLAAQHLVQSAISGGILSRLPKNALSRQRRMAHGPLRYRAG